MKKLSLPKATYIRTQSDLDRLAADLSREPLLALDTEANNLYAYRERVCLIQVSTRRADYIIDPLAIPDLSPLAPLLANPDIEKIFHAAEFDLISLKRDYGFVVNNLFDTMLAARICGYKAVGLGTLLYEFEGIELDKSHQRDDWGQRPLAHDSLLYAQMDTHYLPLLRDRLLEELTEKGRLDEARETFLAATQVTVPDGSFDPEGYWRLAIPNRLTRRETAILRELYLEREMVAEAGNMPPNRVISDKALVELARVAPRRFAELFDIPGVNPSSARAHGKLFIDAILRGERAKPPTPPKRATPADPHVVDCYTLLREWRKQRGEERGVESDVIISREVLWLVAQRKPRTLEELEQIPGLGPWRLSEYGQELLDVLKRCK